MFQLNLLATSPAYANYCIAYHYAMYAVRFTARVALVSAVLFVALVTLSTLLVVYLYNRFESALVFTASVGSDAYDWYDNKVIRTTAECESDGLVPSFEFTAPDLTTLSWNRLRSMCKAMGVKVKNKVQALAELRSMPDYAIYSAHLLTTH